MLKRILRQIHLWLSIPLGLIITVMCLSGAILIFERDFGHIGQAEIKYEGGLPLPLDSLLTAADRYLAGKNKITGITIYPDKEHAYRVQLAKPAMAAIWINQYTGEITGKYERAEIFKIASSAHRRLFGKSKTRGDNGANIGKLIIGITTLTLLLIIVTGIIIWWPQKGEWRKKLTISTKRGGVRFWHSLHTAGGIYICPILIICILTGLNWSFGWYKDGFYGILGSTPPKPLLHNQEAGNFMSWEKAYQEIATENKTHEIRIYEGEIDIATYDPGNQQGYDTYRFNTESGTIESFIPYSSKEKGFKIKGWIYSLHVGSWIGWFTKIIYLVAVITGATLPLTGYYLWIKRLTLKRKIGALS